MTRSERIVASRFSSMPHTKTHQWLSGALVTDARACGTVTSLSTGPIHWRSLMRTPWPRFVLAHCFPACGCQSWQALIVHVPRIANRKRIAHFSIVHVQWSTDERRLLHELCQILQKPCLNEFVRGLLRRKSCDLHAFV